MGQGSNQQTPNHSMKKDEYAAKTGSHKLFFI